MHTQTVQKLLKICRDLDQPTIALYLNLITMITYYRIMINLLDGEYMSDGYLRAFTWVNNRFFLVCELGGYLIFINTADSAYNRYSG